MTYGPRGLDLLEQGMEPGEVIDRLVADDLQRQQRQVGIVDAAGRSASFTGTECFEHAAFQLSESLPLAERMIEALRAGQREGGDRRGQEAAGLYVAKPGGGYGGNHDRYIDLRVDDHDEPIEELARVLDLHHLYFEKSDEAELISADGKLEEELRSHLGRLERLRDDVWASLAEYMAWEYLRRHAGSAP